VYFVHRSGWYEQAAIVRLNGVKGTLSEWMCFSAITRSPLISERSIGETRRLPEHSAIGFIAPKDKMEGRAEAILAEREVKLAAAHQARKARRQDRTLTGQQEDAILHLPGAPGSRESLMSVRLLSNSR
jgi:hypothetical protein